MAWEELAVDVERDGRFAAFIVRCEAGDAIIFLGVDVRYGEGVREEGCVSHCCGWWGGKGGVGGCEGLRKEGLNVVERTKS